MVCFSLDLVSLVFSFNDNSYSGNTSLSTRISSEKSPLRIFYFSKNNFILIESFFF
ncbi:hypothetical protein C1645_750075 [Glomus cerebriforme]|uniref:Uncharacterized protein n=1 Tax=Glomus cerebriforme TaxID=658196 RepID=A0A397TPB4_9GLOM|nr:hypothetical protein C1645_750075 [Glomus cerebriforme]